MDKKSPNPLKTLWDIISLIGGIIGLSSLVQNWLAGVIKWKSWIATLMESYQRFVYPLGDWLLSWSPWTMPTWLIDYAVLGLMFISSVFKGFSPYQIEHSRTIQSQLRWRDIPSMLVSIFYGVLIWPVIFFMIARNYIYEKEDDFRDVLLWFGAILLGFIVLLSINAGLK